MNSPADCAETGLDLIDIPGAAARLAAHRIRTPLIEISRHFEDGARYFVKCETMQRTGSFKFRGAANAVLIARDAGAKEVVACSSGNHAQGVAEAARLFGLAATIVMPADAPQEKIARTRASGAQIVAYDRERESRDEIASAITARTGATFIHPYNDPHVISGQGTVGVEIAEDLERLGLAPGAVLVPASGGGLAAGVTLALAATTPERVVFVVEPEGFDDHARSLASGERERNTRRSGSIADALMAESPGELGFSVNRTQLAGALAVSDDAALDAVAWAYDRLRLVVEPGGAVGLAALLNGAVAKPHEGAAIVVVLSGGNVDPGILVKAIGRIAR